MSSSNSITQRIQHLKLVNLAYLLEANESLDRGLDSAGMAIFQKAAELELELPTCSDREATIRISV